MQFDSYNIEGFYDEYFIAPGQPRIEVAAVFDYLQQLPQGSLSETNTAVEKVLAELGATFTWHGQTRVLPFDVIPRVISASEWSHLSAGLKQRVAALNLFCADIYGEQHILRDGKIPREIVESAARFMPECMGMKPPAGIWCHVSGIDLIRNEAGVWYVLEDNLRVPSGIAYVMKNRQAMERVVPDLLAKFAIEPLEGYSQELHSTLLKLSTGNKGASTIGSDSPVAIAVLTPGPVESAYFEHAFLAQQMGVALVQPEDLVIEQGYLHRRTAQELVQIDILYRRYDAQLLHPLKLGNGYSSGLSAIIDLCQQGRLALANTLGTGVADDKVVYTYVPEMIRYYLNEEPKLPNVPSYLCWDDQDRAYVLDHLDELVVKSASEEGGRGMLVGPHASPEERASFAEKIRAQPREYMAQPTIALSRIPTAVGSEVEGRHVDLRPYVLHRGDDIYVHPGGLTRVALKKGSLVVNSTQGGGSKDTWILSDD